MLKFRTIPVLQYDVIRANKVVIPAGTENVKVAFRQAPWTYVDRNGKCVHSNLYMIDRNIY